MLIRFIYSLFLLISLNAYANCELSNTALYRANELANQAKPISERKAMLQEAIRLCPSNAYAHNNLANLFGEEKQFKQAVKHYELAIKYKPSLSEAYYGLGQAYYELHQLPLSLQALLNICNQDTDARKQIEILLQQQRYKIPHQGQIFNTASLKLLYDSRASKQLHQRIASCGFRASVQSIRKAAFMNLIDETSELSSQAKQQLTYLIDVIENLQTNRIEIASTDKSEQILSELVQLLKELGLSDKIKLETKIDNVPISMQKALESQIRITLE